MNIKLLLFFIIITPRIAIADLQTLNECQDGIYAPPELAPLIQKLGGRDVRNAAFEALTNQEKASEQDKPLIIKLANGLKACWDVEKNRLQPVKDKQTQYFDQKYFNNIDTNQNNRIMALADLYAQKISFGEYIKLRRESIEKTEHSRQEINAEAYELNRKIDEYNLKAQEHNAEIEGMQRAEQSQAWSDFFDSMSRRTKPKPSVNCIPNGLGGFRCQ